MRKAYIFVVYLFVVFLITPIFLILFFPASPPSVHFQHDVKISLLSDWTTVLASPPLANNFSPSFLLFDDGIVVYRKNHNTNDRLFINTDLASSEDADYYMFELSPKEANQFTDSVKKLFEFHHDSPRKQGTMLVDSPHMHFALLGDNGQFSFYSPISFNNCRRITEEDCFSLKSSSSNASICNQPNVQNTKNKYAELDEILAATCQKHFFQTKSVRIIISSTHETTTKWHVKNLTITDDANNILHKKRFLSPDGVTIAVSACVPVQQVSDDPKTEAETPQPEEK